MYEYEYVSVDGASNDAPFVTSIDQYSDCSYRRSIYDYDTSKSRHRSVGAYENSTENPNSLACTQT